ncbi:hypothetical protein ACSTD8_21820 [Vibrio vulnificus]|uniref:hypothetical protein n=1 Tax=Vibrio vulnificus TaxID=672 RepID=UPI003ED89364
MNLNELVNEPEILDKKIYRIFSFERFCQLLVSNQLTFVRPSLWDDPFEDYFFSYKHKNECGEIITFKEFSKNTYGQSAFFKVVVIIRLFIKQLLSLDLDVRHQLAYSS